MHQLTLRWWLSLTVILGFATGHGLGADGPLTYVGEAGPGVGKHIVFLAGDHEYRSEEILPALARIMAKHHGFRCTVLFNIDDAGEIVPGNNNMPHTEVLETADLAVFGLRFQDFSATQMDPIVAYLQRGGPVIGIRTSTHAFKTPADSPYAALDYRWKGEATEGGFGRYVLGETWAGHYGKNHVMSTRMDLVDASREHPVLTGVRDVWVMSGGYWTEPKEDVQVLAMTQPLAGMKATDPPAVDKAPCPGAWVRTYPPLPGLGETKQAPGETETDSRGRVFTTTAGASEDLLNDGFRRMMVNACFWAVGLEDSIPPELEHGFVGPYQPTKFSFDGHRVGVRPSEMAGWETSIPPTDHPIAEPKPKKK